VTTIRAVYKPTLFTFAALQIAVVVLSTLQVSQWPIARVFLGMYALAFGTGFLVGRQSKDWD
jgi:hypothetical protein